MFIDNGINLIKHFLFRGKKHQISDASENDFDRLFDQKQCHDNGNRRIDIRNQKLPSCLNQYHLNGKGSRYSHTAYNVEFPHIQLCFDRIGLVFFTIMA